MAPGLDPRHGKRIQSGRRLAGGETNKKARPAIKRSGLGKAARNAQP
jgi:hypothetical protein